MAHQGQIYVGIVVFGIRLRLLKKQSHGSSDEALKTPKQVSTVAEETESVS